MIEEIQKLGQSALQGWATEQNEKQREHFVATNAQAHRSRKKGVYWYTRFGEIRVEEQTFTLGKKGRLIRPFSGECRGALSELFIAVAAGDYLIFGAEYILWPNSQKTERSTMA